MNKTVAIYLIVSILILLSRAGFSHDVTVSFYRSDGVTPHYCNPCEVEIYNQTALVQAYNYTSTSSSPDYTHTFTGLKTDTYNIRSDVDLIGGLYESDNLDRYIDSNEYYNVTVPVYNRGALATINTTDGSIDGLTLLVAKQLGYSSLNLYNGGSPYLYTDSVGSTEFNGYDTVVVGGAQFDTPASCAAPYTWEYPVSDQIRDALLTSDVFLVTSAGQTKLWPYSGQSSYSYSQVGGVTGGSNWRGRIDFASNDTQWRYFWQTNTTGTGTWRNWYTQPYYASGGINDRICEASPILLGNLTSYESSQVCLYSTTDEECLMYTAAVTSDSAVVVGESSIHRNSGVTDFDMPAPVIPALVWHALTIQQGSGDLTLSGTVYFDFNNDGTYQSLYNDTGDYHEVDGYSFTGDYKVEDMLIELYTGEDFVKIAEYKTDNGRFVFPNLPSGAYRIYIKGSNQLMQVATGLVEDQDRDLDIPIVEWRKFAAIVATSKDANNRIVEGVRFDLYDENGVLLETCTGSLGENNNFCRFYVYAPVAFQGEVKATYEVDGEYGAQVQSITRFLWSHDVKFATFIFNPDLISVRSLSGASNSVTVVTRDGEFYENDVPVGKQVKSIFFRIHKKNFGYITIPGVNFYDHDYSIDVSVPVSPILNDRSSKCDEENDNGITNTGVLYTDFETMRSDGVLEALGCEYRQSTVLGGSYAYCPYAPPGLDCRVSAAGGFDCGIPAGGYRMLESALKILYDEVNGWYCAGQSSCWLAFSCDSPTEQDFSLHFHITESGSTYIFDVPIEFTRGDLIAENPQGENYTGSTQRFLIDLFSENSRVIPSSIDTQCNATITRGAGYDSGSTQMIMEDRATVLRGWAEYTPASMDDNHYNYSVNCYSSGYQNFTDTGDFYITPYIFEEATCYVSPSIIPSGYNTSVVCDLYAESSQLDDLINVSVRADEDLGAGVDWKDLNYASSRAGYYTSSAEFVSAVSPNVGGGDPAEGKYNVSVLINGTSAGFPQIWKNPVLTINDNAGYSEILSIEAPDTHGAGETYSCSAMIRYPEFVDDLSVEIKSGNNTIFDDSPTLISTIELVSPNVGEVTKTIEYFAKCENDDCSITSPLQIEDDQVICTWTVNWESLSKTTKVSSTSASGYLDLFGRILINWVKANFLLFLVLIILALVAAKFIRW